MARRAAKKAQVNGGYTTAAWHDRPLYQCDECGFNTLSEQAIEQHVAGKHRARASAPVSADDSDESST